MEQLQVVRSLLKRDTYLSGGASGTCCQESTLIVANDVSFQWCDQSGRSGEWGGAVEEVV